jgi:flagellar biosynthesis/type III secretory pathway chaperone
MQDDPSGRLAQSAPAVATRAMTLSGARPPASFEACLRAIERVEQVVDQETYALKRHERGRLDEFMNRKSLGLLELTRAMRSVGPSAGESLGPRLRALQAKLSENGALLKMNVEAVQEVSAVMSRAIRDGESDGTYSAALRFAGDRR